MSTPPAELRAQVRAAGLRITGARVALLAMLDAAEAPRSASELIVALATECDRPTVYRNLAVLREAGLIDEIGRVCGQTWYSSLRLRTDGAAVFICEDCTSAHMLRAEIAFPDQGWSRSISHASVLIAGVCPRCLAAREVTLCD